MSLHDAMPPEGSLNGWDESVGVDLPELLLGFCQSGHTGRIHFEAQEVNKRVFLREGQIVFASSSSPDDRLGTYLLRQDAVPLSDLRRLSPGVGSGVRLGTLLVQEGLLQPSELIAAVLGQMEAIIASLFHWPQAQYQFSAEVRCEEESITLRVPASRLILDGISGVVSWSRIERGLGSLDASFVAVEGHESSLRTADLDTGSLEILAKLHHPRTVDALCRESDLADIDVCRRLWAFRVLHWIRTDPPSQSQTPPIREGQGSDVVEASMDADLEGLGLILGEDPLDQAP